MEVQQVHAADWEELRELRLRALADAPNACHLPCATWCCAERDGTSSTPTTVHSPISRDGVAVRCERAVSSDWVRQRRAPEPGASQARG